MTPAVVIAVLIALAVAVVAGIRRLLAGERTVAGAVIRTPTDETTMGPDGAMRSIQSAEIVLDADALAQLWRPETLERLARTYWAFLSNWTLGLIHVRYTARERYVTLRFPPIRLLTFEAPEYVLEPDGGIVRWRIARGLLVAPRGRGGNGHLEIEVRRLPCDEPGQARVRVEVEVANFYPAIAHRLSRFAYANTQSRVHVIVTHGFLRRLVQRDLEESVTRRFAAVEVAKREQAAGRPGS